MLTFERVSGNLRVTVNGNNNSGDAVVIMQSHSRMYRPAINRIAVDGHYLSLDSVLKSPQNPKWLKEDRILTTQTFPPVTTDAPSPVADKTQKNDDLAGVAAAGTPIKKDSSKESVRTYSFSYPKTGETITHNAVTYDNLSEFTREQKNITRAALARLSAESGLEFVEALPGDQKPADLTFVNFELADTTPAFHQNELNTVPQGAQSVIGINSLHPVDNRLYFRTLISHKIGDVAGLKHSDGHPADTVMWTEHPANTLEELHNNPQPDGHASDFQTADFEAIRKLWRPDGVKIAAEKINGANVFTFNSGDGYKKIDTKIIGPGKSRSADTLKFGSGITKEMLTFERVGVHNIDLRVTVNGNNPGDRVTIMHSLFRAYRPAINRIAVDGYYLSLNSVFKSPQDPKWLEEDSVPATLDHPASKIIADAAPVADKTQSTGLLPGYMASFVDKDLRQVTPLPSLANGSGYVQSTRLSSSSSTSQNI